ncbi:MAG: DUF1127 domain-containing protein [Rhodobacteraceae bacterium]|nr:DUF1127 domain-containing protein [Paracoccaceae bacterium]
MAVLDNVSLPSVNLYHILGTYKKALERKWQQHKMYKRTMKELSFLSDRELEDIGINRCDLESITRKTCYNK